MNMTQIAPTTAPRSTSACATQSSAPTASAVALRGLGRYPWASRASGHPARRQRARHNCFPPASPSVAGRLSLEGFEGIYTDAGRTITTMPPSHRGE
jgi:hypothetical protein